eukprot:TRINITY_DN7952_c0_g1_i1.p1 TRINITY_DN7952_c0_g1~~TRINITY_DN7952_c0_g1_i1.p1  ORF type:complete len:290 (+),score=59.48 TRINITY_DN7952_c0_g1_i1:47-916(+)
MQHDDTIWSIISQGFCSFKMRIRDDVGHAGAKKEAFCSNPYNTTGVCARAHCPLANSQYATIVEHENQLYLYMKTVERAHTPKRLWEKILLPQNFKEALAVLNENLAWWDRKLVLRCKQRLLRMKQILIRKRRLAARGTVKIVGIKKKEERVLDKKEAKALKAAKITPGISNVLLERIKTGEITTEVTDAELEEIARRAEDEDLDRLEEEQELENEGPEKQLVPYGVDDSSDEEDEESEEYSDEESELETDGKRKAPKTAARKRRYVQIEEQEIEHELQGRLSKSVIDW